MNDAISNIIKAVARKYLSDSEIMLFGSRARKDSSAESDYDILLLTERALTPKEKMPLKTAIRKELLKSGIRSDILIQSKKEADIKKQLPGHIMRTIFKEAVLL